MPGLKDRQFGCHKVGRARQQDRDDPAGAFLAPGQMGGQSIDLFPQGAMGGAARRLDHRLGIRVFKRLTPRRHMHGFENAVLRKVRGRRGGFGRFPA